MSIVNDAEVSFATRCLANPFSAYAAGFMMAMAVYSLEFSDLYPPLEVSLILFVVTTCAVCALLALAAGTIVEVQRPRSESLRFNGLVFLGLVIVFVADCIYSGGVPLLFVINGADSNYETFGIPTVHVAFVGCCLFYAIYWFDLFLLRQGWGFLFFSIGAASSSIFMVHRGGFMTTVLAWIYVFILRRGLRRKLVFSIAATVALVLWGFGFLGDLRTHGVTGESLILNIGGANDRFRDSKIPTELFWPYLYVSSPLANLQLNMTDRVATDKPALYFQMEYLPDFISKRIVSEDQIATTLPLLISAQLNVTTMYGRAFLLMGWFGLILSFAYFTIVSITSLILLRRSKYYISACSILSSLAFLNIFDNMYIFAGGITQILVGVLLHIFEKPAPRSSSFAGSAQ